MSPTALAAVEFRKTVASAKTAHLQSRYGDRFVSDLGELKSKEIVSCRVVTIFDFKLVQRNLLLDDGNVSKLRSAL